VCVGGESVGMGDKEKEMILKINNRKVLCFHCRKDFGFKIQKQTVIVCKWCNKVVGYLGDKIE